jgi:RHS repeat-associated protein
MTNLYFYEKNHLWTPVALSDEEWNIVEEYEVDEFGNILEWWDSELNDIFFTGKFYDREIGLYYFNARYYNPELGRFIIRDPIGIVDDVNLYVYVGNNPLKFTDPSWMIKKFLATNEWNAWFFSSWKWNDTWHAALYFIYWWQDYLLSYYPSNWNAPFTSWDWDIFFDFSKDLKKIICPYFWKNVMSIWSLSIPRISIDCGI